MNLVTCRLCQFLSGFIYSTFNGASKTKSLHCCHLFDRSWTTETMLNETDSRHIHISPTLPISMSVIFTLSFPSQLSICHPSALNTQSEHTQFDTHPCQNMAVAWIVMLLFFSDSSCTWTLHLPFSTLLTTQGLQCSVFKITQMRNKIFTYCQTNMHGTNTAELFSLY